MLKIKDSSSNKPVNFEQKHISIYNCGPTVYNDIHLGNLRPVVTIDVLYRYLLWQGYDVFYVQNITDIDDKIINRALELKKPEKELSEQYYQAYLKILETFNIKPMSLMPKVSDNIPGIIDYAQRLIDKHHAYVENGDVYFDINSIENYGSVSHQKIDQLLQNARIENKQNKHSPLDFAVWKKTDAGIGWPTVWNKHGRPGWHSECAYLINKYIGKQVDIHAGGVDLKFPHHENENAQNLAINDLPLARCWMHIGHINVNGEKMSKSLNNFTYVKDILKEYDPNVVRWFFYQTRYQGPINYDADNMQTSANEFKKFTKNYNLALIHYYWLTKQTSIPTNKFLPQGFMNAIENDLNFPNMIQEIWNANKLLSTKIKTNDDKELSTIINVIDNMLNILGIKLPNILNDQQIMNDINQWKSCLDNKNYQQADIIRTKLQKLDLI